MPSVSCLCVSRPSRYGQLQRAVVDFTRQSWEDKELVIVVDNANDYASQVQSFVDATCATCENADIQVLSRPVKSQLEGLTFAAAHARGEILTLWDDDNLNAPGRLRYQMEGQIRNKQAITVLTEAAYVFWQDDELFIVDVNDPERPVAQRTIPSSLMAYRRYFPPLEPNLRTKPCEVMLSNAAKAGRKIDSISGMALLHYVGVTRNNVRTYEYHRRIAQECSRPVAWLQANKDVILPALQGLLWDGTLSVEGRDGAAFEFVPTDLWTKLHPINLAEDASADNALPLRPRTPSPTAVTGSSRKEPQ